MCRMIRTTNRAPLLTQQCSSSSPHNNNHKLSRSITLISKETTSFPIIKHNKSSRKRTISSTTNPSCPIIPFLSKNLPNYHHPFYYSTDPNNTKEQIQKIHFTNLHSYYTSPHHFNAMNENIDNPTTTSIINTSFSQMKSKESPISPEQRKAADLELERTKLSTEHIVSTLNEYKHNIQKQNDNNNSNTQKKMQSNAFLNEINVTFNYWISKWLVHYHPYLTLSPTNVLPKLTPRTTSTTKITSEKDIDDSLYSDYGTNQALNILKSLLDTGDLNLIRKIVFANGNTTLVSLIESMLLPCITNFTQRNISDGNTSGEMDHVATSTTNKHVQFSSNTALHNIQPSIWKSCLIDAFHLIDIMHNLQHKCNMQSDINCYNVKLFTWVKLATLLHTLKYQEESGGLNKNTKGIQWKDSSDVSHIISHHGLVHNNDDDIMDQSLLDSALQLQSVDEVVQSMEEVLQMMEDTNSTIKPDHESYNHILTALARSDAIDAPFRAEWYLKRMEQTEDIYTSIILKNTTIMMMMKYYQRLLLWRIHLRII